MKKILFFLAMIIVTINPLEASNRQKIMAKLTAHQAQSEKYPMHSAVKRGMLSQVQDLIDQGVYYVDTLDSQNRTALHWAALAGDLNTVLLLLKHDANTRTRDCNGHFPIDLTANEKICAAIRGKEYFQQAAELCDLAKIREFLSKGASCYINCKDAYSNTPLHFAAWNNCPELAELLLATPGININARDLWGATPLHDAATLGHTEVIRILLAHGADATIRDKYGRLAIDVAANDETRAILAV